MFEPLFSFSLSRFVVLAALRFFDDRAPPVCVCVFFFFDLFSLISNKTRERDWTGHRATLDGMDHGARVENQYAEC